jgi:hypothetical protein
MLVIDVTVSVKRIVGVPMSGIAGEIMFQIITGMVVSHSTLASVRFVAVAIIQEPEGMRHVFRCQAGRTPTEPYQVAVREAAKGNVFRARGSGKGAY